MKEYTRQMKFTFDYKKPEKKELSKHPSEKVDISNIRGTVDCVYYVGAGMCSVTGELCHEDCNDYESIYGDEEQDND